MPRPDSGRPYMTATTSPDRARRFHLNRASLAQKFAFTSRSRPAIVAALGHGHTKPTPAEMTPSANGWNRRAPCKGGAFQWVRGPPGDSLQPEAIGAVMEVTKWLKPSISGHLVTVRVCRPQRE